MTINQIDKEISFYDVSPTWIDIDFERPELGIGVLIYLKSGFITVGYRKNVNKEIWWQLFGDTEGIIHKNDYVTHWMPLPKPPTR